MPYSSERSPASCIDCMAWGILNGRRCAACTLWRNKHHGDEQPTFHQLFFAGMFNNRGASTTPW
jgi:hypothetical protein